MLTCTSPWAQVHFILGTSVGGGVGTAARLAFQQIAWWPSPEPGNRGDMARRTTDMTHRGATPLLDGPHRFFGKHSPGLLQEGDSRQGVFLAIS